MAKNESIAGGTLLIIMLFTILILLTWPQIRLQVQNIDNNNLLFRGSSPSVGIGAWNMAGVLGDFHIITPRTCFTAAVTKNVTCTHRGYEGEVPCNTKICTSVPAGEVSETHYFQLDMRDISEDENFSLNLTVNAYFGIAPVGYDTRSFSCGRAVTTGNVAYLCEGERS